MSIWIIAIVITENAQKKNKEDFMNLENVSTSAIKIQMLSIYGDGKYLNTKKYQNVYSKMTSELMRRGSNKK